MGAAPDELEEIELPVVALRAWGSYWEIAGGEELRAVEVQAWMAVGGLDLDPWEVRAVIQMDRAVRALLTERTTPREGA